MKQRHFLGMPWAQLGLSLDNVAGWSAARDELATDDVVQRAREHLDNPPVD